MNIYFCHFVAVLQRLKSTGFLPTYLPTYLPGAPSSREMKLTHPLAIANDPTAGSPTVTLLRFILPLNAQVWESSRATQLAPTNKASVQCDQMVRLFFNIWPFARMQISPIMSQICQIRLSILPNKNESVTNLPKTCQLLPKWRHFTKSGPGGW